MALYWDEVTEPFHHDVSRCTGECCRIVTNEHGPDAVLHGEDRFVDHDTLRDMLIPLRPHPGKDNDGYMYTCRRWDGMTKLCTRYEERPAMCRDYPYDMICGFCGLVGPFCKNPDTALVVCSW